MTPHLMVSQFARVMAVVAVALVVAMALIRSRRDEATPVLRPVAHGKADDRAGEVTRRRAVTSGNTGVVESCRCIRVDDRPHVFVSSKSSQTVGDAFSASAFAANCLDDAQPEGVEQDGEH